MNAQVTNQISQSAINTQSVAFAPNASAQSSVFDGMIVRTPSLKSSPSGSSTVPKPATYGTGGTTPTMPKSPIKRPPAGYNRPISPRVTNILSDVYGKARPVVPAIPAAGAGGVITTAGLATATTIAGSVLAALGILNGDNNPIKIMNWIKGTLGIDEAKDALTSASTAFGFIKWDAHKIASVLKTLTPEQSARLIAEATRLGKGMREGERFGPKDVTDGITAVLKSFGLDKNGERQGNKPKLPQAPAIPPDIHAPQRKFMPKPVPNVPALSGIIVKKKRVPKVAELSAPHDESINEQLKKLAQSHRRDAFMIEDRNEVAQIYGISLREIERNMRVGESFIQTAARLAGARFSGRTGGADGTGRRRQKTITRRIKDILEADKSVVLEWLHFLPREEREALPDSIKEAILQKLNETGAGRSRIRVRRDFGRQTQRRGQLNTKTSPAQPTQNTETPNVKEKPLTKEMKQRFADFNPYPFEENMPLKSQISENADYRSIDPTLSNDDLKELNHWRNYDVAHNMQELVKAYKATKAAVAGQNISMRDIYLMFEFSTLKGKVNLNAAINTAIALKFAINESPLSNKITLNDCHHYLLFDAYLHMNPRQIVKYIERQHSAIERYCKHIPYMNTFLIEQECFHSGITPEQASKNWAETHRLAIDKGLAILHLENFNGTEYIGIDEDEIIQLNELRIGNSLTPKRAVEGYSNGETNDDPYFHL
jgi:hypothetical protein